MAITITSSTISVLSVNIRVKKILEKENHYSQECSYRDVPGVGLPSQDFSLPTKIVPRWSQIYYMNAYIPKRFNMFLKNDHSDISYFIFGMCRQLPLQISYPGWLYLQIIWIPSWVFYNFSIVGLYCPWYIVILKYKFERFNANYFCKIILSI